jgi:hypothetical protein
MCRNREQIHVYATTGNMRVIGGKIVSGTLSCDDNVAGIIKRLISHHSYE